MTDLSMSVTSVGKINFSELVRHEGDSVVSLEGRLIDSFARSAVAADGEQAKIKKMLDSPDITNPEVLAQVQMLTSQYNIDISLLNTLVRKTVSTAETLLRSS